MNKETAANLLIEKNPEIKNYALAKSIVSRLLKAKWERRFGFFHFSQGEQTEPLPIDFYQALDNSRLLLSTVQIGNHTEKIGNLLRDHSAFRFENDWLTKLDMVSAR